MANAASEPDSDDEHEDQQAVIGAAALGDRHDRQPRHAGLLRHAGADKRLHHRRQRVDDEARQDAGEQAERREDEHRREREAVGLLRAAARPACAAGRGR